ncbi:hypothetical protein Bbelb_254100 [Branchiostoma belcheri]|nr:hypothetical protein Bbelb_254100 [Branchiostoma belcheri]
MYGITLGPEVQKILSEDPSIEKYAVNSRGDSFRSCDRLNISSKRELCGSRCLIEGRLRVQDVDHTGSVGYNTSRALADLLAPLVGTTEHHIKNSKHLAEEITSILIEEDEMFVSHDVVSLFTNTPIPETLGIIRQKLLDDTELKKMTNLEVDDIIELLTFIVTTTYFSFRGEVYQQKFGTAMGSPVSTVLANLFMEWLEQQAMASAPVNCKPKMWKRYVDDKLGVIRALMNKCNAVVTDESDRQQEIQHIKQALARCDLRKIIFPGPRGIDDYARMETTLSEDLTSFTLCVHMRSNMDSSNEISLVSYAVSAEHNNELLLFHRVDFNYIQMADPPVWDGEWHTICTTWRSSDGAWQLYADGVLKASGSGFNVGGRVRRGGTWILGQEQDEVGGGFQAEQSFIGELSGVNLWDHVLSPAEIIQAKCSFHGNVINWDTTNVEVFGEASRAEYHCGN